MLQLGALGATGGGLAMKLRSLWRLSVTAVAATMLQQSAFALEMSTTHKYHAEVRAHQFVEIWTSLQPEGEIFVRAHCSNSVGGIASIGRAAFTPAVTLSFRDAKNAKLGDLVLFYICKGKDTWVEQRIPGHMGLWTAASKIEASAAEVYRGETAPPPTVTIFNRTW
jgi:hypothetical protein